RLVDVLHEPAFRWIRPHLVSLLDGPGEAWLVDVLADGEPGETRDPACVAADAEVRRHLRSDVEQTVAVVTAEEWSAEFSLEPAEVPLWTIYLGETTWGSVIGLSDRRLHYRFARGNGSQANSSNEFTIRYSKFGGLAFSVGSGKIKFKRANPGVGYWWPVESASEAELKAAVLLLNSMALAVRSVQAVDLDEPLPARRP
ncbi:MAG: hypothetical protein ABW022_24430, partial [Actinoplanes sp.]